MTYRDELGRELEAAASRRRRRPVWVAVLMVVGAVVAVVAVVGLLVFALAVVFRSVSTEPGAVQAPSGRHLRLVA